MIKRRKQPIALTIAGSDSGGSAGLQADLKTFASLSVHGTSAVTCVTAQNPKEVIGIEACSPRIVQRQIEAVFAALPPRAVKTGMLFSAAIIRVVAKFFDGARRPPLVVDPVMVATSGAHLLRPDAIRALERLLPLAAVVTPNVDEAQLLTRLSIHSEENLRQAARVLHERFGCAALVKGGHLRGSRDAVDIFFDGKNELLLSSPFVKGISTHGTGCTYSAAITAFLARGDSLTAAVQKGKEYITQAIALSQIVSSHDVLNHNWRCGN